MSGAEATSLPAAIQDSGLVSLGSGGVVLLSGGADSCALAFGLSRLKPRPTLHAVHLNYGLRSESGEDELACSRLCERLAIELTVVRPERGSGNLHAWARQERYRAAERVRRDLGLDWIAVAHTASDLAETVVYRLAVSPGTRALAAMPSRRGAVIRPLLGLSRQAVRRAATAAELPFVDDRSNDDPAFARARIRHEVMPVLADLNPSVLEAVARTREDLAEELDFLAAAGSQLVDFDRDGSPSVAASDLAAAHPAVRRFALRSVAESALGRAVPVSRQQAAAVLELAEHPEGGRIDIGEGASLVAESGRVGVDSGLSESLGSELPAVLEVPGSLDWRGWSIEAEEMRRAFLRRRTGCGNARPRSPRRPAGGQVLARRRPDATPRTRWQQVPAGPLHRPSSSAFQAAPVASPAVRRRSRLGARYRRGRGLPSCSGDFAGRAAHRMPTGAGAGGSAPRMGLESAS